MGKKKKLVIGVMVMSVAGALVSRAAVYQCLPCGIGTYSDGTLTSCATCPEGKVCPAGAGKAYDPYSNCEVKFLKKWDSVGDHSEQFLSGIYMFSLNGAGGGGGAGYGWDSSSGPGGCKWCHGEAGRYGEQRMVIAHIENAINVSYTNGAGGNGGKPDGGRGSDGGSTSVTIGGATYYARGGSGGPGCKKNGGGLNRTSCVVEYDSIGAACGHGGQGDGCDGERGGGGKNGYIFVYQVGQCYDHWVYNVFNADAK